MNAKEMKSRVTRQIVEDIKQERTKIEEHLHALIVMMQDSMLKRRATTYDFDKHCFLFVRDSCRDFARELLIAKLKLLGYTLTFEGDTIFVNCETTCESNESE